MVVRRLGLSPTVAAQIQRYRGAAERDGSVELDEAVSVLRLVGRRPDAALVFADAGRRAARYATRAQRPAWAMARSPTGGVHPPPAPRAGGPGGPRPLPGGPPPRAGGRGIVLGPPPFLPGPPPCAPRAVYRAPLQPA